jgi:hypothetical protein
LVEEEEDLPDCDIDENPDKLSDEEIISLISYCKETKSSRKLRPYSKS